MAQRGAGAAAGARPRTGARPAGRGETVSAADHSEQRRGDSRVGAPRGAGELATLRARLRSVIEPVVISAGFDLEDLTVTRAGRRHVVRVTIDSDHGVSHDDLGAASRDISAGLDSAEQSGGEFTSDSYTLELSSPGIDRPLTAARHWRRNVGRLVKVKAAERLLTGRVVAVEDNAVTFDTDGRQVVVALDQLGPGRVQIEFTRLAELAEADFGEAFDDDDESDDEYGTDEDENETNAEYDESDGAKHLITTEEDGA